MDKPVLIITGVCGRIGSAAAEVFAKDFHVVGFDVVAPKNPLAEVEYLLVDISSMESVETAFHQVKEKHGDNIASFIHLAAYYNFTGGEWEKYEKITIEGTRNLLLALKNFQLEQFVFSSTMLVHAPCKLGEKISESSKVDPKWDYPISKMKTEKIIEDLSDSPSVILRIAGIYDDDCNSIPLSQQILRIYRKELESHLFPGNLKHGASFLHMDDLVAALKAVVVKKKELGSHEIFVLGEPDVIAFGQLQKILGELIHGKAWWTLRVPKWFAKMGAALKKSLHIGRKSFIQPWMIDLADDHYDLDIGKSKEVLGWEPAFNLKNCLPKFVSALKENPQKWIEKHEI
ncbi:MAG: NAD(P)-dependent oxidoreductase [Simkaniaceae bacterium]|nr:NAD(P)-dependent oxidoreductase [Candidatus Sacchlamyda saccharinae]